MMNKLLMEIADAYVEWATRKKEFPMFKVNKRELSVLEGALAVYEGRHATVKLGYHSHLCFYLELLREHAGSPRALVDKIRGKIRKSMETNNNQRDLFLETNMDVSFVPLKALRRVWLRKLISYNTAK